MPSLLQQLTHIFEQAFENAGFAAEYGEVKVSDRPDLSQFQCNGALKAAKAYKTNPRQIASKVVDSLKTDGRFTTLELAGPGFINITLNNNYLIEHIHGMLDDDRLGVNAVDQPLNIIIDYGGANVAKAMHVGHLRAAIIGESLKRLCRFLGHNVLGDVHMGDWGLQMGQVIVELERRQPDLPYFDPDFSGPYPSESPINIADLETIYPAASKRAKSDEAVMTAARQATLDLQQQRPGYYALWRHIVDVSVADLKRNYHDLNVEFDLWLGESDVQDRIPAMIERLTTSGFAVESRGATVIDISLPEDNTEYPPLILVKSDGAVLYGTTDLATIEQRMADYHANLILYVVDNRQSNHFRQVFRAAYKTGTAPRTTGLEHAGFGTMNGRDGKPFKTREGGVMKLRDLIDMVSSNALTRMDEIEVGKDYQGAEKDEIARKVGLAALKFADLSNHRQTDYIFDLDRFSSFEGRTGPYLLYTAVRIKSILRKATAQGLQAGQILPPTSEAEKTLLLKITELPDILALAFEHRAPNYLADYAYVLATQYNRFYIDHHILREPDPKQQSSWLALSTLAAQVLEQVLDLLGMEIPERM